MAFSQRWMRKHLHVLWFFKHYNCNNSFRPTRHSPWHNGPSHHQRLRWCRHPTNTRIATLSGQRECVHLSLRTRYAEITSLIFVEFSRMRNTWLMFWSDSKQFWWKKTLISIISHFGSKYVIYVLSYVPEHTFCDLPILYESTYVIGFSQTIF